MLPEKWRWDLNSDFDFSSGDSRNGFSEIEPLEV